MTRRETMKQLSRGLVLLVLITFCAAAAWAGEAPRSLPRVAILAMGGTIAGQGASALATTEYKAGVLDVGSLVASVPGLGQAARISAEQVANIDSAHITNEHLLKLARRVNSLIASDAVDGIVVTHGTDTLEETAYFLNLVVEGDTPVVLTGSMRPATALSADGPLNLYNAVVLAGSPQARGQGVLVAMNERIDAARDVTKTHTTNVDTFRSPEFGCLGYVIDGKAHLLRATTKRHTLRSEFRLGNREKLPRAEILYGHGNDSRELVDAAVRAGAQGIVHAGVGDGGSFPATYAALTEARAKGVVVVRASRVGSGPVAPNEDDRKDGMVTSGTLNPQKARILLMLALTRTADLTEIRRIFAEY